MCEYFDFTSATTSSETENFSCFFSGCFALLSFSEHKIVNAMSKMLSDSTGFLNNFESSISQAIETYSLVNLLMLALIKRSMLYCKEMIDLSYFIHLSNNKTSFLLKVMDIFIEETPNDLAELQKNFQEGNYRKVKEICHKLKGLFKSYNMKELTSYTIELEANAKAENFSEESKELLRKIQETYNTLRIEMVELKTKYKA